jgi:hypothetical protein
MNKTKYKNCDCLCLKIIIFVQNCENRASQKKIKTDHHNNK